MNTLLIPNRTRSHRPPRHPWSGRLWLWACLLIAAPGISLGDSENQYAEQQQRSPNPGADPWSYAKAADMYEGVPLSRNLAPVLEEIVADISAKIQGGATLEDPDVWMLLTRLNPVANAPQVQLAVEQWVVACVARIDRNQTVDDTQEFQKANQTYRRPKKSGLEDAVKLYLEILRRNPGHLDARNNLALAALHQNQDLAAQVQLRVLRRLAPDYAAAAINLTVVYERAGLSEKAEELARLTATNNAALPAALFNAAWYQDLRGDRKAVGGTLAPLASVGLLDEGKFQELNKTHTVQIGLVDRYGGKLSTGGKILAVAIFAILTLVLVLACGGFGRICGGSRAVAFLSFVVGEAVLFSQYWGDIERAEGSLLPLLILAVLIGGACLSAARARKK